MKFNIRGSKEILDESVKNYIETKIGKLNKFFEKPEEICATVSVKTVNINEVIEVTIPIRKAILRSEVSNKDIYTAIDLVLEKLESQLRRNKTKLHKQNKENNPIFTDFESVEEPEEKNIIKRKKIEDKPMSEEEAILQMELLDHDFFMFHNIKTGNISVIYRRKDQNYGLIEIV